MDTIVVFNFSIFQSSDSNSLVMYCSLPIPDDFLWQNKYFRYKYAIFYSHWKGPKFESLALNTYEWRVIGIKQSKYKIAGIH